MSENSTRPDSEEGVGPARRPSIRRIGASGLRDKPKWRSLRLKSAAIWGMSVKASRLFSGDNYRISLRVGRYSNGLIVAMKRLLGRR
jgi:hypothetical protein